MAGIFSKYPLKDDASSVEVRTSGGAILHDTKDVFTIFLCWRWGAGKLKRPQSRHLYSLFFPLTVFLARSGAGRLQLFLERHEAFFLGRRANAHAGRSYWLCEARLSETLGNDIDCWSLRSRQEYRLVLGGWRLLRLCRKHGMLPVWSFSSRTGAFIP